ncbi:tail fiber/spike domain-containing protein, partial [Klebsiella aerogenes]
PANSTPESSGGIGPGAWIGVGDASLRANLGSSEKGFGLSMVALEQGGFAQQAIQYITPQMKGAPANGTGYDTDAM